MAALSPETKRRLARSAALVGAALVALTLLTLPRAAAAQDCANASSDSERAACVPYQAAKEGDPSACQALTSDAARERCLSAVGGATGAAPCSQLTGELGRAACDENRKAGAAEQRARQQAEAQRQKEQERHDAQIQRLEQQLAAQKQEQERLSAQMQEQRQVLEQQLAEERKLREELATRGAGTQQQQQQPAQPAQAGQQAQGATAQGSGGQQQGGPPSQPTTGGATAP